MATGRRLLSNSMPYRYRQGTLCPTRDEHGLLEKSHGNRKSKKAGRVRKMGQNKVRKQLARDLRSELDIYLSDILNR